MPSSHTPFGPWRKTRSKEKVLEVPVAPHLTRKTQNFAGFFAARRVSCCFSCGSHRIMATEMLLVCGEDSNRFGLLEHGILETLASFYGTLGRAYASFYSSVFLLCSYFTAAYALKSYNYSSRAVKTFQTLYLYFFFLTMPADKETSKSICYLPHCACEKRIPLPNEKVSEYKVDLPTQIQTLQRGE